MNIRPLWVQLFVSGAFILLAVQLHDLGAIGGFMVGIAVGLWK